LVLTPHPNQPTNQPTNEHRKQEAAARRRSLQQQGKGRKRLCGSDRQPLRQLSASQAARGGGGGMRRASAPSDLKENRASWANTSYASVSSTIGKSGLGKHEACTYV
jgi:hypothetical protein